MAGVPFSIFYPPTCSGESQFTHAAPPAQSPMQRPQLEKPHYWPQIKLVGIDFVTGGDIWMSWDGFWWKIRFFGFLLLFFFNFFIFIFQFFHHILIFKIGLLNCNLSIYVEGARNIGVFFCRGPNSQGGKWGRLFPWLRQIPSIFDAVGCMGKGIPMITTPRNLFGTTEWAQVPWKAEGKGIPMIAASGMPVCYPGFCQSPVLAIHPY